MILFGLTDIGLVRRDNQDSYAFRVLGDDVAIAVVCDGMGGAMAGNVASAVAVEAFAAALEDACRDGVPPDKDSLQELLRSACRAANRQVFSLSAHNEEYRGMGTTLVGALILPHEVYVINVGDSRGYLVRGGHLKQLTQDHSVVQTMVNRGSITPEQARTHPRKNLITRAVGIESTVEGDLYQLDRETGDILLLCSDGLSNVVEDAEIESVLTRGSDPEACCRTLLSCAVEQGAPDNVTVVMAQLS